MSQLAHLKDAVDQGKTAKHRRYRSILHILIKKELGFYAKQFEGYRNPRGFVVVSTETVFYPTWEMLIGSFDDLYVHSQDWIITDEPLEDYLPPERKTVPGPEQQPPS